MPETRKTLLAGATCSACQYHLRNAPENRCPECGQPFDPDDPNTYSGLRPIQPTEGPASPQQTAKYAVYATAIGLLAGGVITAIGIYFLSRLREKLGL